MRRLTEEISVGELMRMREQGMSNKEIAKQLDVTTGTIYRYIGAQPSRRWGRENRAGHTAQELTDTAPKQEPLSVVNQVTYLEGVVSLFTVDLQSGIVLLQVKGTEDCITVSFEQWESFSLEIQAIQRQLSRSKMTEEANKA